MYLPSNTPLLLDQRDCAARAAACSDARVRDMRQTSAAGRIALFNTLVSPQQVAQQNGIGAAIDTAKLQNQTRVSRAAGLLGGGSVDSAAVSSRDAIIAGAPEVVSLNRGGGCAVAASPVSLPPDPSPGMPARAPEIVDTVNGPMYYRGAGATFDNNSPTGLTGYAPPWSDAYVRETPINIGQNDMGVVSGWLMDNPWLALAIGAGAVAFFSRRSKR